MYNLSMSGTKSDQKDRSTHFCSIHYKGSSQCICYRQVCLKQLIFVQKTNLLERPPIWDSQIKDKRS